MASPGHNIDIPSNDDFDLQTMSLEGLVQNLTSRMELLEDSISLISLSSSPDFKLSMQELEQQLESSEAVTDEFSRRLDEFQAHIFELGELKQAVKEENELYQRELDNLPDEIVALSKDKQKSTTQSESENKLPTSGKGVKSLKQIPRIHLISQSDFDKTPGYLRGRMIYEKFCNLVEKLQGVLEEKYKIASLPISKVQIAKMQLYHAYKNAEIAETKGGYFFVEEDIKQLSDIVMDPSVRTALAILRHHHSIREVRGNKLVSTKLREALGQCFRRTEERLIEEQRSISHARRVSKAQERSMSEEGKKKRKVDQLRQLTEEEIDVDYPVSSASNNSATPASIKPSNQMEQKQTSNPKDKQSAGSSIVSSVASSEDSSIAGTSSDRGRLLTSITAFKKSGLARTETEDRSVPHL